MKKPPKKKKQKRRKLSRSECRRRLGIWRTNIQDQNSMAFYVTLAGYLLMKPYCFKIAETEKEYIDSLNLDQDLKPLAAIIDKVQPYCKYWVPNTLDFYHWYIPESIVKAYNKLGLFELYEWQAECLYLSLGNQKNFSERFESQDSQALNPSSVLYTAPTSGGKSLVAEILMIRCLYVLPHISLCKEKAASLRDLLGNASVGLRIESYHSSEGSQNIRLNLMSLGSASSWHKGVDIAVCTIEKANAIINRLILELMKELKVLNRPEFQGCKATQLVQATIGVIGLIVIDEMHYVGDEQRYKNLPRISAYRGFLLELFITKLKQLNYILSEREKEVFGLVDKVQLVAMSATIPNIKEVADWIDAKIYSTDIRPTPLNIYVKYQSTLSKIESKNSWEGSDLSTQCLPSPNLCMIDPETMQRSSFKDSDHLGYLVWEKYKHGQQTLIFCATKQWCQTCCSFLKKIIPCYKLCSQRKGLYKTALIFCAVNGHEAKSSSYSKLPSPVFDEVTENINEQRKVFFETIKQSGHITCPLLLESIPLGIAYHHAGMSAEERHYVEMGFRSHVLLVICATSTLAVGVNLPVSRVIFRSAQVGNTNIDSARFQQMAGRAGRKNLDVFGEAIVMCSSEKEYQRMLEVIRTPVSPICSVLTKLRLARMIIELIVLKLVYTVHELYSALINNSLLVFQMKYLNSKADSETRISDFISDVQLCLNYLEKNVIISWMDESHTNETFIDPLKSVVVSSHFFAKETYMHKVFYNKSNERWNKLLCNDNLESENRVYSGYEKLHPTPLGKALVECSVSVDESLEYFGMLYRDQICGIKLNQSNLDLLLFVAQAEYSREISYEQYFNLVQHENYSHFFYPFGITRKSLEHHISENKILMKSEHLHEALMLNKLSPSQLHKFHRHRLIHQAYYACVLSDMLEEIPPLKICNKYNLRIGEFAQLRNHAIMVAGLLSSLCNKLEWLILESALSKLKQMLQETYVDKSEVCFQNCDFISRAIASSLYEAGITSVNLLARLETQQLIDILSAADFNEKFKSDASVIVAENILNKAKEMIDRELTDELSSSIYGTIVE